MMISHFHFSHQFSSKGRIRINKKEFTFFPLSMDSLSVIPSSRWASFICWMLRRHRSNWLHDHLRSYRLNILLNRLSNNSFLYYWRLRHYSLLRFLSNSFCSRNNFSFSLSRRGFALWLRLWLSLRLCILWRRCLFRGLRLLSWFYIAWNLSKFCLHFLSC